MVIHGEDTQRFADDGYLLLPGLLPTAAVEELRGLLLPLFERLKQLPARARNDLGTAPTTPASGSAIPELLRPIRLEPRLVRTQAYAICHDVARHLVGRSAGYSYDHVICKPPDTDARVLPHQDQAYTGHRVSLQTVHFWIPLQAVTEQNGCVSYVPGSHRGGLLPHRRVAPSSNALAVASLDGLPPSVACPLPSGGVAVHGPLTVHSTGPNVTPQPRFAWVIHFGPYGRMAKLRPSILGQRLLGAFTREHTSWP